MSGFNQAHPHLECVICDDNDACLPRWEDDGGGMDQPPSYPQTLEEDSEQRHGHHDRRIDGPF
ncbi:hypothetical protein V5E97_38960 [Singulisphaera sp. Ch08]|uniref:Uncharacterized protein n=1 Tax=Singulisphaera sp. Ch08 TaxID=3120278 RepID=A0AAU7CH10_9BACT